MAPNGSRVLVLGLDSVPPDLLFERFLPRMPHLKRLMERSRWGTLRSCDPPITVPAWAVMFTGMDPGMLGLYGFRHRRPGTYWETYTPTPKMVRYPAVWDVLSRLGKRVAILGMPPGYPPPIVNGVYVADFLTPARAKDLCTPASLAPEIEAVSGGYQFDVPFRREERERIGEGIFEMTRRRWTVARHLWEKERWDLFALHEIGPDRLHHTFWKYFDRRHPRYTDHPGFRGLVEKYYELLDEEIGRFLSRVPEDVVVMILSDHGSQAMDGCFCINEWLRERGYLALKRPASAPGTPLENLEVDWSKTIVWGAGGYYARLFFNVAGREPDGLVAPGDVSRLAERIRRDLSDVRRPDGAPLDARVMAPSQLYQEVHGDAPDLMVYFGDLRWRSAGTMGHDGLFLAENDTGPDDAVHSFDGVFVVRDPRQPEGGRLGTQSGIDIAPTLLERMGVALPAGMQGRPIRALLGTG